MNTRCGRQRPSTQLSALFTTGGPTISKGGYINDYYASASVRGDFLLILEQRERKGESKN
jgi:hypothetical protein